MTSIFFQLNTCGHSPSCNILSDEGMGLLFTIAAGPRQHSYSRVKVLWDSWPHFTVSDSRLPQPRGSGPCIYIPQGQGGPLITKLTGFPFCRLLRLAGLQWRYWNPHNIPNTSIYCFEQLPKKLGWTEERIPTVTPKRRRRRPLLGGSGKCVTVIARQRPLQYYVCVGRFKRVLAYFPVLKKIKCWLTSSPCSVSVSPTPHLLLGSGTVNTLPRQ
jgi:hypothetical protein